MNQQLQDFCNHLNEAVLTTNNFAKGIRFRKREEFAYCGLNPVYRSHLSFDLDFCAISGVANCAEGFCTIEGSRSR